MPSYVSPCGLTFLERSCGWRRPDADRELPHEGEQAFRLLDLRKVTGFWDKFEACIRERLGIGTSILRVDHAITHSPHHEDRDAHPLEPSPQLGITHALSLIIDVERPDVCSASLDKNETAKPPCGIAKGHGRRDPATHQGADDQDIMQVEPFEQVKVGEGEIINTVEPLRARLARKARVGRHQDVRLVQTGSDASHGLRATTTMQDQNGTTAPVLIDAHSQAIGEGLSSRSGRRRESAHVLHPFCWIPLHRKYHADERAVTLCVLLK